ncbi:MAG: hypothetical protein RLZZ519_2057 [Bacteroidota bacterium]|jgi:hypothetical protein
MDIILRNEAEASGLTADAAFSLRLAKVVSLGSFSLTSNFLPLVGETDDRDTVNLAPKCF